jgi:hypothetical protein
VVEGQFNGTIAVSLGENIASLGTKVSRLTASVDGKQKKKRNK